MSDKKPETKYLKDYTPLEYLVESVDLIFDLREEYCLVNSTLSCRKNPESPINNHQFCCHGEDLELVSILLNDKVLTLDEYVINAESLAIMGVPDKFILKIETKIYPHKNTALEGLYKSGGMFCTQCEAQGFRRITFFPDRPDIMSKYTTKIIADSDCYPVLLSNGNRIDTGVLDGNRHWVKWEDPFKKPSYLFALVAGNLSVIEDDYITCSGRKVTLKIFVEKENIGKCDHAMQCLKQAMQWDEDMYGREYDLDIFMIVAVDDFNAGAMENKGLNIFNSSYILAKPETATDADYEKIQGVIAHEYFHNWTGNRITCRDWFQLSLKEGLTIFRDQQFSADMTSKTVKRISDVKLIRTAQFAEDSGPMAHQVRPDSFIEINNFYTITVYYKGAELIRMLYNLLGKDSFYKGMKLYFDRHDGQAVTTEDFVKAMEDANNADLQQFRLWYTQAGTTEITVKTEFDSEHNVFNLTLEQTCPPTPEQSIKQPFHIPVEVGLLDTEGNELPLYLESSETGQGKKSMILDLKKSKETFRFSNISSKPVPSILRNFSAPVKLKSDIENKDLIFLMSSDSDEFNRWESAQLLMTRIILKLIEDVQQNQLTLKDLSTVLPDRIAELVKAQKAVLENTSLDKAFIAQAIALPTESYLSEQMKVIDVETIHVVRKAVKVTLAKALKENFLRIYRSCHTTETYCFNAKSVGQRSLKNLALSFLMSLNDEESLKLCTSQYKNADNMTDEIGALTLLANRDYPHRNDAIEAFHSKWHSDSLVMNMWLSIQASSDISQVSEVKKLMNHPVFEFKNPNKLRALVGTFCNANLINFHVADGTGYDFLANQIIKLDKINPQIASRLLAPFIRWKRFDEQRSSLIKSQLERILQIADLSKDVYEVVSKSLK